MRIVGKDITFSWVSEMIVTQWIGDNQKCGANALTNKHSWQKKNEGHHFATVSARWYAQETWTWRSLFKSSVDKHIPRQYLRTRSSPSLFADWIYICNHFRASPGHTVVLIMLEESYSNMNFWQNSSAASCSVIVGSILLQFLVLVLRHQFSMKLSPICEKSLHDAQALA